MDLIMSRLLQAHAPDQSALPSHLRHSTTPTCPSSKDIDAFVSGLKGTRILAKGPETLQQLSVACILKNKPNFIDHQQLFFSAGHNNPFANLSNKVTQVIFLGLAKEWKSYGSSVENAENFCFVLLLLNQNVTKFEKYYRGHGGHINYSFMDAAFFKHMLDNCPKLESVEVSEKVWCDDAFLPRACAAEELFYIMAEKWPNLTSLKFDYAVDDSILEAICRNCQILSFLDIDAMYSEMFSMVGVQHLSTMKHLKHLRLKVDMDSQWHHEDDQFLAIVHAVGSIPSLEKFAFDNHQYEEDKEATISSLWKSFVYLFGQLYPTKMLVLEVVWFDRDFAFIWPECLSVEELYIIEASSKEEFELKTLILGIGSSVKKLTIRDIAPSKLYPLVEQFGPGLTDLTIELKDDELKDAEPMDAFRVVAACPKLERIFLQSSGGYEEISKYTVTADHFKNCEKFTIKTHVGFVDLPEVSELFTLWVCGTKRILKEFTVNSVIELESIISVLSSEQTCLNQLEEIVFWDVDASLRADVSLKILQVVLNLALSPCFLKVFIRSKSMSCEFGPQYSQHSEFLMNFPGWFLDILKNLSISFICLRCNQDLIQNISVI